ncbi:MAG: MFS transporter [Acidimicrobiales bacterium]
MGRVKLDVSAGATRRAHARGAHAGRGGLGSSFRRLWTGAALASAGDGFAYGAVPLLAVVVDPHPLAVSAVVASDSLPWLLVALPAGQISDRFARGHVMAFVNLLRGVVLACAGVLVVTGRIDLSLLIVIVLANAGGRAIYYSALQATVPDLVTDERLDRANGALSSAEMGAEHLGGPIVGTLTFVVARAIPFFGDAGALGLSSLPLLRLRSKVPAPSAPRGSILDGLRHLLSERRLRMLLGIVASLAGLQGLVSGILVLVATRDWGVHTGAYGFFVAAGAAGNIPGALSTERLVARFGSAGTLVGAAGLSGLAYLAMAFSHAWLPAGIAFAVAGFAVGAGNVAAISLRQRLTPHEMMGRVGSAWRGIVFGAAPVGALLAGGFALLGGLRLPLILAGSLQCLVAVVLGPALLRAIPRKLPLSSAPPPHAPPAPRPDTPPGPPAGAPGSAQAGG